MRKDYDLWMKWNDRLLQARNSAGLTDTDIARALDVKNPTVHGWMTGKTINIEARYLLPLSKMLGVSPFWIMFDDSDDADVAILPTSASISAMDTIRLIALFAQTDDEGRQRIIDLANAVKRTPGD